MCLRLTKRAVHVTHCLFVLTSAKLNWIQLHGARELNSHSPSLLQAITSPATCAEGVPQLDTAASPTAGTSSTARAVGMQEAMASRTRQYYPGRQHQYLISRTGTCAVALGKAATAAGGVVAANAEEAAASSATRSVVVELPDIEPDLCSICLDPFTTEDPANSTQCE